MFRQNLEKGPHLKKNAVIALLFVLFVSLFYFFRTTIDPDLWGHLQFGKDIYELGSIPEFDTYSYSAYGERSINHEWLAELIFYFIFVNFSSFGLILFKFSIAFALSLLVYREIRADVQSKLLLVAVFLGVVSTVSYGFAIRTQIFTYWLFAVVLLTLKRHENDIKNNVLLFSLPPIFLFWCNLHGGFVAALAVMAVYIIVKLVSRSHIDKNLIHVTLLSVSATLVNPYGIDLWKFLLRSMTETPLLFIDEWNRVSFSTTFISYFLLLAVTLIVLIRQRLKPFEYVLFVSAVFFSFKVNRHTVLFALIFAMFLPKYLGNMLDETFLRIEQRLSDNFFSIGYCLCSLFFLWGTFFNLQTNPLKILISSKDYPVEAVQFLKVNEISGNIFAWFDWGLMCIGELSPKSKVFFDGRFGIVYDDQFIREYFDVVESKTDYKSYLNKFPETDIFLLHKSNPLSASLSGDADYELVFSTDLVSVFLKKNQRNKETIRKFNERRLVFPDLKVPFYFEKMPRYPEIQKKRLQLISRKTRNLFICSWWS